MHTMHALFACHHTSKYRFTDVPYLIVYYFNKNDIKKDFIKEIFWKVSIKDTRIMMNIIDIVYEI